MHGQPLGGKGPRTSCENLLSCTQVSRYASAAYWTDYPLGLWGGRAQVGVHRLSRGDAVTGKPAAEKGGNDTHHLGPSIWLECCRVLLPCAEIREGRLRNTEACGRNTLVKTDG